MGGETDRGKRGGIPENPEQKHLVPRSSSMFAALDFWVTTFWLFLFLFFPALSPPHQRIRWQWAGSEGPWFHHWVEGQRILLVRSYWPRSLPHHLSHRLPALLPGTHPPLLCGARRSLHPQSYRVQLYVSQHSGKGTSLEASVNPITLHYLGLFRPLLELSDCFHFRKELTQRKAF